MAENGITREWLDELRSRNDIVTTVSRYLPLERKGRNHWGRCPFHHEKTPSFAVDEGRQVYHCFGCGESGDVFKFIQKIESVEFMDAVKLLAEAAHMEVPSFRPSKVDEGVKKKRDEMLAMNRAAALWYHRRLAAPEGQAAAQYLERRGVSPAMIVKFGIGVSPGYQELPAYLRKEGCDLDLAVEGGLLGRKDDRGHPYYYDVFGGRLIFPILDSLGNVVAFGGRILEKNNQIAKYRNTGATFLFDKSKNIYAINLIKKLKLKKSFDSLILCEGYLDVVALHQAGFDTAVASMGTALTVEQCRLLKRFCTTVYISYDGDAAGQKGMMRGLDLLVEEGLTVKVIALPDGLDPDECVSQRGAAAYRACLDRALPYFEYKLHTMAKDYRLHTFDGRTRFATAAVDEIRKLDNKLEQELYLKQVRSMTDFSAESLARQLDAPVEDGVERTPAPEKIYSAYEKAVRFLLHAYINRKPYVDPDFELRECLEEDELKSIYDAFAEDRSLRVAAAYGVLPEPLHAALSAVIDDTQGTDEQSEREYYRGCLRLARKTSLEERIKNLSAQYDNAVFDERKKELLREIMALQARLNGA